MKDNLTPIICDINIWYRLADGRIDPELAVNKYLVGTYINAYEFCCSHNAYTNYGLFRSAIIAYRHYPKEFGKFCPESPSEYMKMISNHKSNIPDWKTMSDLLDTVVKNEHHTASPQLQQVYSKFDSETQEMLRPFEELISDHRGQIENRGIHKNAMNLPESRLTHKEITKELLTMLLGGISINWIRLELFLNTFDEWIRQLSIQSNLKMNANDWHDVMNLVYVQPGSLYWTYDNRKTKGFIQQSGGGSYLYESNQ